MTDASRTDLIARPRQAIPRRTLAGRARRAAVVLLLVLGLVATATGGLIMLREASVPRAGEVAIVSTGTSSLTVEYVDAPAVELITYEHGADVSYAFELRNDGPLPVTVEAVPVGPIVDDLRLIRPTGVLLDGAPFEPFRLAPGTSRKVIVTGVFDNCAYYTERAMDVLRSQPVTWSVVGWSTTTEVELTRQLAVRSPYLRICPDRVMDRGARTRTGTGTL